MINQKKTELMSKAALFEQGSGTDQLKLKTYFEGKRGRLTFKHMVTGAVIYILLVLVILLIPGYDIFDFNNEPVRSSIIIIACAVAGIIFTVFYVKITGKIIKKRYRNIRSTLVRYDLLKSNLRQLSQDNKE